MNRYTAGILAAIAAVLLTMPAGAQKKTGADAMFEAARQKETLEGDLSGAIKQYGAIVAKYKNDRGVTAMALVRMAEAYQKMGNTEARKIYEQVVREYADQKEAVAAARAGLGVQVASNTAGNTRQVWTKLGGFPYGPVSRDGRYVAFTSYAGPGGGRTGPQNLAVHDLITGADLVLTKNESPLERPGRRVFSPDSRQIGYIWIGNGKDELRIINLNGNGLANPRVLFKNDEVLTFGCDDWSPDGKWIALQLIRKDRIRQLGLVSTTDGTLRVLKSIDWTGSTNVYFSPDSRYLAFDLPSSENSEKRDIFVIAVDGSREIPAVIHPANDRLAGWTPEGKHLLFISDRNGRPALWSLPFESGRPQGNPEMLRPDFGANHYRYLGPTRSGELYFLVLGGGGKVSIASVDLESGKSNPTTMEQFTKGIYPAWSADGKYLVYTTYPDDGNDASAFLTIRSVATGQTRELRPNLKYLVWPSWSPDGRSLLVPAGDAKGRWGIFRIDAQTAEVEPIAISGPEEEGFMTPQWLPDGKGILYERGRKSGGDGVIVKRELISGKESAIVRVKLLPNQGGSTRGFVVSPDGRSLAYLTSNGTTAHTAIMLMPLAGGQPRELLKLNDRFAFLGGWTPDSQSLLYSRNAGDGRAEALLLPVNGGEPRKLDLGERFATELQMHPDGKRVAFWSNNQTPEQVWVLENFLPALTAKK